jgi:hypothetical protein
MDAFDFQEVHARDVRAPAESVRAAIDAWRPASSPLWRALLITRGLGTPAGTLREWAASMGFVLLAESERAMVFGQAGTFWSLRERGALVSPKSAEEFRALADPRIAAAAMSIGVVSRPEGARIVTITRVRALGPAARRRFRVYWMLIRPFSGLLRRSMLRGIATVAES